MKIHIFKTEKERRNNKKSAIYNVMIQAIVNFDYGMSLIQPNKYFVIDLKWKQKEKRN